MKELNEKEVWQQLDKEPIFLELFTTRKKTNRMGIRGFEDEKHTWYICGINPVSMKELTDYTKIFKRYFEKPIKDFDEPVIPETTVPEFYIEFLNKMNALLVGGIAAISGILSLEQQIETMVEYLGGCSNPPINLFNNQSFYAKSSEDLKKTELVRICPHYPPESKATIEYMVCRQKPDKQI